MSLAESIVSLIPLFEQYVGWVAMALGIAGAVVVAYPTNYAKVKGFEIWAYANVLWCITAIILDSIPLLLLNIAYFVCNVVGISKHMALADAEVKVKQDLLRIPDKTK